MIVLKSFDKKTWSFWSLHRSCDDTNATKQIQIKNETIKTNMRQINQDECETITNDNHWVRKSLSTIWSERRSEKSSKTIWRLNDHYFLAFYRVQMTWNITIDYSSHVFTKRRNDVWIKQTNKLIFLVFARRETWKSEQLQKALFSDLIITSNVTCFESFLQNSKALNQFNKLRNFFWKHVICALRV
jgi:hypothetical protein